MTRLPAKSATGVNENSGVLRRGSSAKNPKESLRLTQSTNVALEFGSVVGSDNDARTCRESARSSPDNRSQSFSERFDELIKVVISPLNSRRDGEVLTRRVTWRVLDYPVHQYQRSLRGSRSWLP